MDNSRLQGRQLSVKPWQCSTLTSSSEEQAKAEDGAWDWVSGNTGSVLSSTPDLLSHPKAHVSFVMLCFYLLFCICLAVLNEDVETISHYKLAWYLI